VLEKKRTWLLIPAEDGLTAAPLAFIGVDVWSIAGSAAVFGALHYPAFAWSPCVAKSISRFVALLLLLPYGLWSVVVGHLLLDLFAYGLGRLWNRPTRAG